MMGRPAAGGPGAVGDGGGGGRRWCRAAVDGAAVDIPNRGGFSALSGPRTVERPPPSGLPAVGGPAGGGRTRRADPAGGGRGAVVIGRTGTWWPPASSRSAIRTPAPARSRDAARPRNPARASTRPPPHTAARRSKRYKKENQSYIFIKKER